MPGAFRLVTTLRLTCGPAGNRTTTGSLPTTPQGHLSDDACPHTMFSTTRTRHHHHIRPQQQRHTRRPHYLLHQLRSPHRQSPPTIYHPYRGRFQRRSWYPIPETGNALGLFFSSSLADVALRLDSHMSISSEKILCKDTVGPYEQADQNKLKITKTTNHDDPQIPQPDLRFVRESGKPDQEPNQTQTKTGLEPKSNTHNINLPKDTVF